MKISPEKFEQAMGRVPEHDDLERCNCEQAGDAGHICCGWCESCDRPQFACMCWGKEPDVRELHTTGIFEAATSLEVKEYTYKVGKAAPGDVIPNFGVLPIKDTRMINIIFEDGTPEPLAMKAIEALSDLMLKPMVEKTYFEIIHLIHSVYLSELERGHLFRDINANWQYKTKG